ncbi:MAG: hypothetical protein ACFCA4_15605 [Cyanophyceae cyanobacterium]
MTIQAPPLTIEEYHRLWETGVIAWKCISNRGNPTENLSIEVVGLMGRGVY